MPEAPLRAAANDRHWYHDAVVYQTHVRAFADSDDDGIGDFPGLIGKLDYLQDLGVTAIWLLPFYPSPLRDDGYDIANYTDVHPSYGTLAQFETFLDEAHRRNLRVITELVLNHTSDQHAWFQRARRAPAGSPERDFYVWSNDPRKYAEARIIFQDFEPSNWTWDSVAGAYFWHRFFFHQPDLNFDNPAVHEATFEVLDFWLQRGVDGLRLDAVPYLYEREGTNCENLPETHAYLKKLRRHVDERFANRMLLAEANQWPEDAIAYFGSGDECHMAFHFPLMPRLFMALRMEDGFPITDILAQTPAIPESCQWALFLRNHDELTLEMVTDEDRDYMYRFYAQDPQMRINLGIRRRLAPLLENHRGKIELLNALLFSLPGTPVIYYGDEIGMGDNIYLGDRNGVRTPMQWNGERNAGFSRANPQRLYMPLIIDPEYHYQAVNVEAQQNNSHSLLWWMKRMIGLRRRHPALSRGTLAFVPTDNPKVLAFVREHGEDSILVVANLSRLPQYVKLDLGTFVGRIPTELMGRTPFAPIASGPYTLALGSHAFYWLDLELSPAERTQRAHEPPVTLWEVSRRDELFSEPGRQTLQRLLPQYLRRSDWFQGGDQQIEAAKTVDAIPLGNGHAGARLEFLQVRYAAGDAETYLVPLAVAAAEHAEQIEREHPHAVVSRILESRNGDEPADGQAILYDPSLDRQFAELVVEAIAGGKRIAGRHGELAPRLMAPLDLPPGPEGSVSEIGVFDGSQTSSVFGSPLLLKLFRRVEPGANPEWEVLRALERKSEFRQVPQVIGALEYRQGSREPCLVAVLERVPAHQGNMWNYTLEYLSRYYEQALTQATEAAPFAAPYGMLNIAEQEMPKQVEELLGSYLEMVRILAQRAAELHDALATLSTDAAFAPEPFTTLYQRSLYQSLRSQALQAFHLLRRRLPGLPEGLRESARRLLALEPELLRRGRRIAETKVTALKTRGHGDFHLGKALFTGKDVVIVDFEGGLDRPLSDRRRKRTPMRDVAEMLSSFHYAALTALGHDRVRQEDEAALAPWMQVWQQWVGTTFLKTYLDKLPPGILPASPVELEILLDLYLLKRAASRLNNALLHRPERTDVAVQCLLQVLELPASSERAAPEVV